MDRVDRNGYEKMKKIAFFLKGDDKFINEIIERLSTQYETKKIIIKPLKEINFIDPWMKWADICWFEWCDDLVIYGSKLEIAKDRIVICRLHSYEAFSQYPYMVNWSCVNSLVFVSEDIRKYVTKNFRINENITVVIPNGIDLGKWKYQPRMAGFKLAFVGYINYKKGPMLLLQTFKAIYDHDNRFKLYIAGKYQDPRYELYFGQMKEELGLENNFFYEGWQENMDQWLEDKNYILCTSVLESQNLSVMQAMAKGIKPVIHNFAGAAGIYPKKYLWNTIGEAVRMITEGSYDSIEYRDYISSNYSIEKQSEAINFMLNELSAGNLNKIEFDYKDYWNKRLISNFNIEGVGYFGLGEVYNGFLYRNRISLLDSIINRSIGDISSKKVLEFGPGTGIFTEYFGVKGVSKYTAIDIANRSVEELQKKYPGYEFIQGDICDSHINQDKYGLVFAANVLQSITDEKQFKKAISAISDRLEEEGLCLLLDPISVIHARSTSAHVKIRDREYLEEVFREHNLEIIEVFPITYFMNYPFDGEIIGSTGEKAHQLFQLIMAFFSDKSISDTDKRNVGEYLYYKDKQLLLNKCFGLSEKIVMVKKQGDNYKKNYTFKDLMNIDNINNLARAANEKLGQSRIFQNELFIKVNSLLACLDSESKLTV